MDSALQEGASASANDDRILIKIASRSSLDTTASNENPQREKSGSMSPGKFTINDYNIIKTIGKGSYGKVVLAKKVNGSRNYAIKIIEKQFIEREDKIDQIHIERQILSKLSHPNIIKLFNTFHDKNRLYYVFEYAEKGDLKEYLNIHGLPSYNMSKFIISEIINALEYIHSNNIIHRDLKPENIVLNDKLHLKLVNKLVN